MEATKKLYLKNSNYQEEKLKEIMILISKNSTDKNDLIYLEGTSKSIWNHLSKLRTFEEIIDFMRYIYYVPDDVDLESDLNRILTKFSSVKAIDVYEDIKLEEVNKENSFNLSQILSNDEKLSLSLTGAKPEEITSKIFYLNTVNWQDKTNSITYAIIFNEKPIGTISLSHIDNKTKSAQIGYWLSSDLWNLGITSKAFSKVIDIAKAKSLDLVKCKIPVKNEASFRIWNRYRIEYVKDAEYYHIKMYLLFI
jgi:RimJ/RimL family protein N-acetyltransferase